MSKSDINYLRAEMQAAQSAGETKAFVSIKELQSVLHKIAHLEHIKNAAKVGAPKQAGFIMGDHLRNLCDGSANFAKIKKKSGGNFTTALYFFEIEGDDSREKHRIARIEKARIAKEKDAK